MNLDFVNDIGCIKWIDGICKLCRYQYVLENFICRRINIIEYNLFTKQNISSNTLYNYKRIELVIEITLVHILVISSSIFFLYSWI